MSQRTAQRLWGDVDPVGQRIAVVWNQDGRAVGGGTELWMIVIGVAGDVRFDGLTAGTSLDVYAPNTQAFAGDSFFLVRTRVAPDAMAARLPRAIQDVDPEQSFFDVRTLTDRVQASIWQQRVTSVVVGASGAMVSRLMIREAVIPVIVGMIAGAALSGFSTMFLARAVGRRTSIHRARAAATIVLVATAAFAAWLPVRRVLARANLVHSLRA